MVQAKHDLDAIMRDPRMESPQAWGRRGKLRLKSVLLRRVARMRGVEVFFLRGAGRTSAADGALNVVEDPVTMASTTTSVAAVRRAWQLGGDRFWFGVIGAISKRKNVDLICQALAATDGRIGLLLAGLIAPDAQVDSERLEQLAARGIEVRQVSQILSDIEIDSAVAAVDCVLLMHSNEGPSGILGKAAATGTRVVAGGAQSLRDDVTALHLGTWVPLDPPQMAEAFTRIMRRCSGPSIQVDVDVTHDRSAARMNRSDVLSTSWWVHARRFQPTNPRHHEPRSRPTESGDPMPWRM